MKQRRERKKIAPLKLSRTRSEPLKTRIVKVAKMFGASRKVECRDRIARGEGNEGEGEIGGAFRLIIGGRMRIDGRRRLSSLLPPFRLRTYRKSGSEGIDTEKVISIIEPFWYDRV